MAMKTSSRKDQKGKSSTNSRQKEETEMSSHLSALVMLSQQLLSIGRCNKGIPSFVTKGVDSEQLWQQIELRNNHQLSLSRCTKEVVNIANRKRVKREKKAKKSRPSKQITSGTSDGESGSGSDQEVDNTLAAIRTRLATQPEDEDGDDLLEFPSSGEEEDGIDFDFDTGKNKNEMNLSKAEDDDDDDDDDDDNGDDKKASKVKPLKKTKKKSAVDDKFFKMADMEEFLDAEDAKEERRINREKSDKKSENDDSSDEDDEEIDYFAAMESDEENEELAKYGDFFDPPDGESQKVGKKKRNKEADENGDEDEDEEDDEEYMDDEDLDGEDVEGEEDMEVAGDDDEEEDDEDGDKDEGDEQSIGNSKKKISFTNDILGSDDGVIEAEKSTFEKKQEKMMKKVKEMEELSLKAPSWELTGEVMSSKRPENSLLESVLDFQHTQRAAPVITDDTTKTLEDYIRLRIKDKTFDDVERKEKPKEDVFEFKKRIVLDQEKSKQSLAEIYEQEFVKQQQKDTEEVKADPQCENIEKELGQLFYQLDALCNYRYTPMKPGTEVKIVVNTPAISLEEVAPVATTDADLLAPEEVMAKRKGDLKANEERDETDRKRARRQKKMEKREKMRAKEAREKKVEKLKPGMGNAYSKMKALKKLEEISKSDKSVSLIKDSAKNMSSSSFFSQLQDEVTTNVKAVKAAKEKKKKKVDVRNLLL